jgi:hypothetical protein
MRFHRLRIPNPRSNLPRFRSLLLLPFGNGPAWDIISVDLKERFAKSEIDKTEFEEKRRLFWNSKRRFVMIANRRNIGAAMLACPRFRPLAMRRGSRGRSRRDDPWCTSLSSSDISPGAPNPRF